MHTRLVSEFNLLFLIWAAIPIGFSVNCRLLPLASANGQKKDGSYAALATS